jgi:uncharacterized protein (UPF0147 family)
MTKSRVVLGILAMTVVLAVVTGCGSNDKPAAQQPASQQQAASHGGHSATMPKEDPMPMMKDMDKDLRDMMKQVKAGQTMEVQKTTDHLVNMTNKVMPHMMDNGLKENLRKAAADIKDIVNSGKMDPGVMEGKVKTMQEVMKQTTSHLQTMSH